MGGKYFGKPFSPFQKEIGPRLALLVVGRCDFVREEGRGSYAILLLLPLLHTVCVCAKRLSDLTEAANRTAKTVEAAGIEERGVDVTKSVAEKLA